MQAVAAAYRGLAPWTRYHYDQMLLWWCNYLSTFGAPPGLAASLQRGVKPQARTVCPTSDEIQRLTALASPDLRLLLLLASQCGMRSGAALRLAPKHVVAGEMRMPGKGGSEHRLPLPPDVAALVGALRAPPDSAVPYVAALAGRQYARPDNHYHRAFAELKRRAGVREEITMHDMRRSIARRVYKSSGDLRVAQALLGHRHLTTTLHYLREALPVVTAGQLADALKGEP